MKVLISRSDRKEGRAKAASWRRLSKKIAGRRELREAQRTAAEQRPLVFFYLVFFSFGNEGRSFLLFSSPVPKTSDLVGEKEGWPTPKDARLTWRQPDAETELPRPSLSLDVCGASPAKQPQGTINISWTACAAARSGRTKER